MDDMSYLDQKYFVTLDTYNCPFCNRRHVRFTLLSAYEFNWSTDKVCYVYFVGCHSCKKVSMHLSYEKLHFQRNDKSVYFDSDSDLDDFIFYSVPKSFFILDKRIPSIIRELITEAEGCLKMNFLTGSSACVRKAIYEICRIEKATGSDYESKIKSLKGKYPLIDSMLFDSLASIQGMTSDKIHEQSWDKWESIHIRFIIALLKNIIEEIYVEPEIKKDKYKILQELKSSIKQDKQTNQGENNIPNR
jgi:hypothetical protein